jgi:predicted nucleotidyltransferase
MKLIELNLQKIFDLCRKYKVDKLYVFGSILTPRFNSKSDVDMVVNFKGVPLEDYVDNYFGLKDALTTLLGREIDLLESNGIRNAILRNNIDRTKRLIYG